MLSQGPLLTSCQASEKTVGAPCLRLGAFEGLSISRLFEGGPSRGDETGKGRKSIGNVIKHVPS